MLAPGSLVSRVFPPDMPIHALSDIRRMMMRQNESTLLEDVLLPAGETSVHGGDSSRERVVRNSSAAFLPRAEESRDVVELEREIESRYEAFFGESWLTQAAYDENYERFLAQPLRRLIECFFEYYATNTNMYDLSVGWIYFGDEQLLNIAMRINDIVLLANGLRVYLTFPKSINSKLDFKEAYRLLKKAIEDMMKIIKELELIQPHKPSLAQIVDGECQSFCFMRQDDKK